LKYRSIGCTSNINQKIAKEAKMKKLFIAMLIVSFMILGFTGCKTAKDSDTAIVCYGNSAPSGSFLQAAVPLPGQTDEWLTYNDIPLNSDGCGIITVLPKETHHFFIDATKGRRDQGKWYGPSMRPTKVTINGINRPISTFTSWTPDGGGYKVKI
jgi:hypothetical protein